MFTGIVRELAGVVSIRAVAAGIRLAVRVSPVIGPVAHGDSIAVNGVCLTAAGFADGNVEFDVVAETLRKTTLGDLKAGDRVNVEPALRVGDPLGGHFVQGHVDGVGRIEAINKAGGEWLTVVACDAALTAQMIRKGSITVDGVSLTIVDVQPGRFSVALIPTTLSLTTLGFRTVGAPVNIETDMIGKYALKAISDLRLQISDLKSEREVPK